MTQSSARRVLCLAALVATLAACGKKGDPEPPILLIPAPTTDLAVVQRGDDLLLDFAYPQTTAAGTPLPRLEELAVWQLSWRAPEGTPESLEVDEVRFLAGAQPVRVLSGEELGAAVAGDRVRVRLDVPPPAAEAAGVPVLTLAVKTEGPGGEESVFSNRVSFVQIEPPVPPTALEAEGEARGVLVRWEHPDVAPPGGAGDDDEEDEEGEEPAVATPSEEEEGLSTPSEDEEGLATPSEEEEGLATPSEDEEGLAGFSVYRRLATERAYGPPLRTVGRRARRFLDESALFGESYIYTVAAVASRRPVMVESDFAEEVEVVYRDVYPPPVPEGLVALTEGDRVRLVWEASAARDLAGYRVYRRSPDTQEFRPVTDQPVTGTDFTDRDLAAGATYTYRVTAVDRLGNESQPSDTTTAAIR